MPSPDELAKHEHAAGFVMELRRRGVPCHVRRRPSAAGDFVDVIIDPERIHPDPAQPNTTNQRW